MHHSPSLQSVCAEQTGVAASSATTIRTKSCATMIPKDVSAASHALQQCGSHTRATAQMCTDSVFLASLTSVRL